MSVADVISLLGGIALFLYGMAVMGDNLKKVAGSKLELSDSWGLAGHVGIDFQVGAKGAIRVDYRKIDIDTKVKLNGANLGTRNTVNIDPAVYGIAYVLSF